MRQGTVKLVVPFATLVDSVKSLAMEDKRRLWELLDAQVAQEEEQRWEADPTVQAEIREARAAYAAGDSVTIEGYVARRQRKA